MQNDENINDTDAYLILKNIDENIGDIKSDLIDINDYLTIQNSEIVKEDKNEDEKKEDDKKEENITKSGEQENQQEEQSITLEDISIQLDNTNHLLDTQNNLLIVNIFSSGIIAGVLLLTLFWNRFFK